MTAADKAHLFNLVLTEICAAFVVIVVTFAALFACGRFDAVPPMTTLCIQPAPCEQLLEP